MKKPKITDKLDALATRMVNRAMEKDVPLEMQTRVFQALTGYYSAQAKAKKLDDDQGDITFNTFRSRVASAEIRHNGEEDG